MTEQSQYMLTVPVMRRGRRPSAPKGMPRMTESEYEAAVAKFLTTRGITRCPTACVIRTQGMPDTADREALRRCVAEARLVYLSGVSLAIIGDAGRSLLYDLLGEARSAGAEIGFDPNFRPQVWDNIEQARNAMEAVAPLCRYISAGEADLAALYGDAGPTKAVEWAALGAEVVVRAESHRLVA